MATSSLILRQVGYRISDAQRADAGPIGHQSQFARGLEIPVGVGMGRANAKRVRNVAHHPSDEVEILTLGDQARNGGFEHRDGTRKLFGGIVFAHDDLPCDGTTLTGADDPVHAENAFTPFLGRREELRLETEKAWGEAILGHTRAGLMAVIFLSAVLGFSSALLIKRGPEFLRALAIERPA